MKTGILNLTSTPIKIGVNSNATEIINICNDLNERGVYCEVINTIETPEQSLFFDEGLGFNSIYLYEANQSNYDFILLMNSHPNFFGGKKDDIVIDKFKWLAKCKCPILYLFNDRNLPFEQLWKNIKDREWNDCIEEDVKIIAPIYVISQFRDLDDVFKINNKYDNIIECKFIDFGVWILKSNFIENKGLYDLIYGGSFRGGRREKKFVDFFFNKDLNVAFYGTIKLSNFKGNYQSPPKTWLGKVPSDQVIEENSLGFSTIIVGEKGYNNNIEIIRIYESILSGAITFIDNDFDQAHFIYPDNDFLYIYNGNDLETKIKTLKTDKDLYDRCIRSQNDYIERKKKVDYIGQLVAFMEEKYVR